MAKVPACAKAYVGRWRIAEMDVWDNDFLDLVEEAHLTFKGQADGEIAFGALKGFRGCGRLHHLNFLYTGSRKKRCVDHYGKRTINAVSSAALSMPTSSCGSEHQTTHH